MTKPDLNIINGRIDSFKGYVQKVLPAVYDDTLSYYELLSKIITHLNENGKVTNEMLDLWNEVNTWLMNEGLQDSVNNKVDNLVQNGTLENMINETLLEESTQSKAALTKLNNREYYVPPSNVSPKVIYNINGVHFIVTKKASGKGYLRFDMRKGIVDTGATSIGGSAQLTRLVGVLNVTECILLKNTPSTLQGSWADSEVNDRNIMVPVKQLPTSVIGDYIEYDVVIPKGVNFIETLVYFSSGSSSNVDISIDGTNVQTAVSFQRTTGGFSRIVTPITYGSHKIRFTNKTTGGMTIAGTSVVDLSDYKEGYGYDSVITYHTVENPYVTNQGAIDYAMVRASDDKYIGSYHGGETLDSMNVIVDGMSLGSSIAMNTPYVGYSIEVEQQTNIVSLLNAYTRAIFRGDGAYDFEVFFSGDITLKKLWTNMTTAHPDYTQILYPIRATITSGMRVDLPGDCDYLVQRNPTNNQKIVTIMNNVQLPEGNVTTPYLSGSDYYNKLYKPNIDSEQGVRLQKGMFKTIHIFD